MLDVLKVAQILGVHRMTVYRLIHAGKIDAIQVGRSYRISQEDFDTYLRKVRTRGGNASGAAGSPQA